MGVMAPQPVPRRRTFAAPARSHAPRRTPAQTSPTARKSCLLCVNGWIEHGDLVEPCPNCRPGIAVRTRPACQRCHGRGVREVAPEQFTQCARCDGSGFDPGVASEPAMPELPWGAAVSQ